LNLLLKQYIERALIYRELSIEQVVVSLFIEPCPSQVCLIIYKPTIQAVAYIQEK